MIVKIGITVRDRDYALYDDWIEREVEVKAELGSLSSIPWQAVCAGLVESGLAEANARAEAAPVEVPPND